MNDGSDRAPADYYADVGSFHAKFGLPAWRPGDSQFMSRKPHFLSDGDFDFRFKFMLEELNEMLVAHERRELAKVADAVVDLVYVALGTAHLMHLPFERLWQEVQAANMRKERAAGAGDPRSTRGHSLDVVKPAGWVGPDVEGVLRAWHAYS